MEPSREDIRQRMQKHFPRHLVDPEASILVLNAGTTGGRAELIHLADLAVTDVTAVEPERTRLATIRPAFPRRWRYLNREPTDVCREAVAVGTRYELVIADGSPHTVDHLWLDLMPLAAGVAGGLLLAKVTGDFLTSYGVSATEKGLRQLLVEHGMEGLTVERFVPRSRGHGGTSWAVVAVKGLAEVRVPVRIPRSRPLPDVPTARISDAFEESSCVQATSCIAIIDRWRRTLLRYDRSALFRAYTPSRLALLPDCVLEARTYAAATVAVRDLLDEAAIAEAARLATSKRGTVNRKIRRATEKGYFVDRFHYNVHVGDIRDIHFSREQRGGKPLKTHYRQSVAEMGGYASEALPAPLPDCPVHSQQYWGVFLEEPDHRQGPLRPGRRLVAYIHFLRRGTHGWYGRIMGHADHLPDGVMYQLHYRILTDLVTEDDVLAHLCYGAWHSGPSNGSLQKWKKRGLFQPMYLVYADSGEWHGWEGMHYFGEQA